MDKTISQDIKRNRDNDQYEKDSERYDEEDMIKIAEVANTIITETEGSILIASINNWTINAMNILEISEDL